jgi:hypothetical protein
MTAPRVRTTALFVSTFLFPALGFPLVTYLWWRASESWAFVSVVMGVPVVFGYVMPGIAINLVKRWRMTSGPRMGSSYVHHGFVYGSKLALALFLVVRSIASVQSAFEFVAIVLVTGSATAFGGWWHDAHAIRAGKIEVDGGSEALMDFAPVSYFSMGGTYAAVTLASYVILSANADAIVWVWPLALVTMCAIPSAVFLAIDPPTRRALRTRFFPDEERVV